MGIGERLKELRKNQRITLRQLALKSKVSKAYLSQLENERFSNPSTEIITKLCYALGVSVGVILGLENNPTITSSKVNVPLNLITLAEEEKLNEEELSMLSGISYKGKQPKSIEDWRAVLQVIQKSTESEYLL